MSEGLNQAEVSLMIKNIVAECFAKTSAELELLKIDGCQKGKAHQQWHEDKLTSDIVNLQQARDSQDKEMKEVAIKLSGVIHVFERNLEQMSGLLYKLGDQAKEIDAVEQEIKAIETKKIPEAERRAEDRTNTVRNWLWAIVLGFSMGAAGLFWNAAEVKKTVSKVNQGDLTNQVRTEALLLIMASSVSGKSEEQIGELFKNKIKELEEKSK